MLSRIRAVPLLRQYVLCLLAVALVASGCFLAQDYMGHRVAALVLLMTVSVLAMLFRIGPVLASAAVSALVWNFFFIPPVFTFHIVSAEDLLMFLMYFVVASVNAVLSLKIRQAERRAQDKEQKEKAIALYNTVLNSLSHELRTPITAIIGGVDALQQGGHRLSADQRAELLAGIDAASERLDRQVGDLLDMGRLESGTLAPKRDWCDVNEVISGVIHRATGPGGPMHFVADPTLPLFKLDEGLLVTVLRNLVDNALRYTAGAVQLAATYSEGGCTITVADEGPGIAPAEREHVFEKFHRGEGLRTGGSGLGLSIVKGFVEAQGGTVTLSANVPAGAIFTVRIPAETSFISNLKHE